jgi:hypothetical protein
MKNTGLLFSLSRVAFSQERKPIPHETMWAMKRVSAPAISPDGQWVVFSVIGPSYNENGQVAEVREWLKKYRRDDVG